MGDAGGFHEGVQGMLGGHSALIVDRGDQISSCWDATD